MYCLTFTCISYKLIVNNYSAIDVYAHNSVRIVRCARMAFLLWAQHDAALTN